MMKAGGRGLKVVFICQAADRDDPVQATTVRWIEALDRKRSVEQVAVLALRTGRHDLPSRIEVNRFGRPGKLATLVAFYRLLWRAVRRHRPDFFFVHQTGPYPLLLLPFKLVWRTPIVQWVAHPAVAGATLFSARWCDDLVVTSARAAVPTALPKVQVVGQGVDTEFFRPRDEPRKGDLIAVCRIAPRKRVDQMIRAVASANREQGTDYLLNVYGPHLPGDRAYLVELERLLDELDARRWVAIHGPVRQEELPTLLNSHRACLNFSTTAIDRSVVEAMACCLPVISTNDAILEIMPEDLRPTLITDKENLVAQSQAIHALLRQPDADIIWIGERLRDLVVREHNVNRLFDRILDHAGDLIAKQP